MFQAVEKVVCTQLFSGCNRLIEPALALMQTMSHGLSSLSNTLGEPLNSFFFFFI